jgi:hypothetical protein
LKDAYAIADGSAQASPCSGAVRINACSRPRCSIVGTNLATDPWDIDNRLKSGDLQASALYNFDIQPAMARPISSGESS